MNDIDENDRRTEVSRRHFDPVMFLLGLATLAVAAYILSYGYIQLPHLDPRWVLAGGGVLIGLLMLTASLRPRRGRNR